MENKVQKVPIMKKEQKAKLGLLTAGGRTSSYKISFYKGLGAFRTEKSWDKLNHLHRCCKSKVHFRHRVNCPKVGWGTL